MIDEDDPSARTTARACPWWFVPALLGVALGGLLGLGGTLLPAPVATTAQLNSTSVLLSPPPGTASLRPTLSPSPTLSAAPRDVTLALADLPPGFALEEERDDQWDQIGTGAYVGGWLAFYGRTAQAGVTSVTADTTAWLSADGAAKALAEAVQYVTQSHGWGVEIPLDQTIGDESHAIRCIQLRPAARPPTAFTSVWRTSPA